MRISDWSSDVCSSDLGHVDVPSSSDATLIYFWPASRAAATAFCTVIDLRALSRRMSMGRFMPAITSISPAFSRSEEHTSELQSLMRISYAVFCLQKKNKLLQKKHQPSPAHR